MALFSYKRKHLRAGGFTLIELAIVLVIIGIILAMVVKGFDIVRSAKIKKAVEFISRNNKSLLNAYKTCYEIVRFSYPIAGDTNGDGVIDTDPLSPSCNTASCRCFRGYVSSNLFRVSDMEFYVYAGHIGNDNVLVVCLNSSCTERFTAEGTDTFPKAIRFAQSLDTYLDPANDPVDVADDRNGYIKGATSVILSGNIVTGAIVDNPSVDNNKDWEGDEVAVVIYIDDLLGLK